MIIGSSLPQSNLVKILDNFFLLKNTLINYMDYRFYNLLFQFQVNIYMAEILTYRKRPDGCLHYTLEDT